ncbi:MAG: hypothetical protein HC905_31155 [Bacteroidales bacterium]|nr:hypothetical protein [Bacteroidales bacterium]
MYPYIYNCKNKEGQREIGTRINGSSEVVRSIENNQEFQGRSVVVDAWYLTAYSAIIDDGVVIGMLGVGFPEKDLSAL